MSGLKPELFDYPAAVEKANAEGFDWNALASSVSDPGFSKLSPEHQKHIMALLMVRGAQGTDPHPTADPNKATGDLGGFKQLGSMIRQLFIGMDPGDNGLGPSFGVQEAMQYENRHKDAAVAAYEVGMGKELAERAAHQDLVNSGNMVMRQFAHYFTGGLVDAPEENKDVFVKDIMDRVVKPTTMMTSMVGQYVTGSALLGWVSKAPLISMASKNMSVAKAGLIKNAILDFGIRAAWPEGLPKEEQFGVADDFARLLAPEEVERNPTGFWGRTIAGAGGAIEGGILGYTIHGIAYGSKLANAHYGWTASAKTMEMIREQLTLAGQDVSKMSRTDAWLTYRTRVQDFVQGIDEAVFNGERLSAEEWIAHAFLADPNVKELTNAQGRILHAVFSSNRGGISMIKGVENPAQVVEKLNKVGIKVDAVMVPRKPPPGASAGPLPPAPPKPPDAGGTKVKPPKKPRKPKGPDSAKNAPTAAELMQMTPEELEKILHPGKGLPPGTKHPKGMASVERLTSDIPDVPEGNFKNPNEAHMDYTEAMLREATRDAENARWDQLGSQERFDLLVDSGFPVMRVADAINLPADKARKLMGGDEFLKRAFLGRPQP